MPDPKKPEIESGVTVDAPPKKSKKKLIIIILVATFLIVGGTTAYLLLKPSHPAKPVKEEATDDGTEAAVDDPAIAEEVGGGEEDGGDGTDQENPGVPPVYAQLGTFTANLVHEEGDRYLQVAIQLKITVPELADKIKATNPEILHYINMLLQSKRPSELASFEGKQKLAEQIKEQVEYVLGLRKNPTIIIDSETTTNTGNKTDTKNPAAEPARKTGVAEVLFTSFIIQ